MTADELRGAIEHLAVVMQPYFDARADRLRVPRRRSLTWDWSAWDEVHAEFEALRTLHRAQRETTGMRLALENVQAMATRATLRAVRYKASGVVLAG